jgi:hypothetical protein
VLRNIAMIAVVALLVAAVTATAQGLITGAQIKNDTVTGQDVKNRSLTQRDFKGVLTGPRGRTGARGPQGPQGLPGPTGAQGPPGPTALGQITVVQSAQVPFGPSDLVQSATAFCPAGQRAVSGGGVSVSDEQLAATQSAAGRLGWTVIGVDLVDNGGEYVQAQALCAPQNQAVAARLNRAKVRRQVVKLEARVKAQYAGAIR